MDTLLRKNDVYECVIDGYTSQGMGVCRVGGRAVFVPRAIRGERWRIRVVKVTNTAVWGRGEVLLDASPSRMRPACALFGKCGGCALMHMDYGEELRFKLERVNSALLRIGSLPVQAEKIVSADQLYRYRNKGIYNFSSGPVCGFYRPRSHDVVAAESCLLQPESFDAASHALLTWMRRTGVPAYDETTGCGFVRHLLLRRNADSFTACIVSAGDIQQTAVEALRSACPDLTGVMLCVNRSAGNVVLTDSIRLLWGSDQARETVCGASLQFSPLTFFQVNTAQAEKLYHIAGQYAQATGKTVLDLYCGAGSLGIAAARGAKKLIGSDIVFSAVENARANAVKNGLQNSKYICGDASAVATQLAEAGLRPDVILTDPPRKGMDAAVRQAIVSMAPERVVYISCNPATLARDLKYLREYGFFPQHCVAVDLFPRTPHVETVVSLRYQNPHDYVHAVYVTQPGDAPPQREVRVKWEPGPGSYEIPGANYRKIKAWIYEHYDGMKVSSLYIAQVKAKHGIIKRECYNKPKNSDARQPQCPPENEKAIEDALRHFGMIN